MASGLIAPHGGTLINRIVEGPAADKLSGDAANMPRLTLSPREQCDLEMIAIGAFSPITGFMGEADFRSVCESNTLATGEPWTIPVTLSVSKDKADTLDVGSPIALVDDSDRLLAVMTLTQKYHHDKALECPAVYGTDDEKHPGVAVTMSQGDVCLAGDVDVVTPVHDPEFPSYRLPPAKTREAFAAHGWQTIVAFQTRNPIHRAHEYLTKCALEITDGLLIHPLVGETKAGDIPADVRMKCYEVLIEKYYNTSRTMLSVMPAAMRYAGPKEAILHALVRKNYGCTHFIVGRDHAGVGDYYGTYDAQKIFDTFEPAAIGITPLKFEHSFFCKKTGAMASDKTTNSTKEERVFLSGTKVREMLVAGQRPPEEFTRHEVADILMEAAQNEEAGKA